VAAAVLAAGVVAGCSGADHDNTSSQGAGSLADGGGGGSAGDEAAGGGGEAAPPLALATGRAEVARAAQRDVVRTGTMALRVDDVDDAADAVRALARDSAGFVADEQADAGDHEVQLTIRVPADRFEDVRRQVDDLGDVVSEKVEARDVTAEVVDVDSRVRSLRASVDRVRALLARAGDIVQLATVEGELARRETELEALLGQQRVLKDQVSLGTLTVELSRDAEPTPVEGVPGFGDALHRGWVALVDVVRVAVAAVGLALPFLVPAAVAALAYRWWRRRPGRLAPSGDAPG
jgi:hypothetical protein